MYYLKKFVSCITNYNYIANVENNCILLAVSLNIYCTISNTLYYYYAMQYIIYIHIYIHIFAPINYIEF